MDNKSFSIHKLEHQGIFTLVAVILIGYVIGLITSETPLLSFVGITTFVLTAVYLLLILNEDAFHARYGEMAWGTATYFVIQLGLVLVVQILLGPGGPWLMSLPLAAIAVERLKPIARWPVYLGVLGGLTIPLILLGQNLQSIIFSTLSFSPAIIFVVVFTKLLVNEKEERERIELLSKQLEEANQKLSAYAAQAGELATSKERNRLAREIHDNLGHYLTVVNVQIKAAQAVMNTNPAKAHDSLEKAQNLTQEGLKAIRQSVAALRESPLEGRPLPDAIRPLIEESRNSGIVSELEIQGQPRPLDPKTKLTLYRTVQEGLTNIRKHAHASRADIRLDYSQPDWVSLQIRDNGVGTAVTNQTGFGLLGIRERVNLLNGEMEMETAVQQGFTLSIKLPTNNS